METKPTNPLAIVAAVAGLLAIIGHCGCCIPIVSYFAPFLVIFLELAAIISGVIARGQADPETGDSIATAGLVMGGVAVGMSLLYTAIVVLSLFGIVGLSVLSAATQ